MSLAERHIATLAPYVPGRSERDAQALYGFTEATPLASNENQLGPSARAVEAVRRAAGELHRYPDGSGRDLKRALAARLGVAAEGLVLGNGSNEIIELVVRTFLRPGEIVLFPARSFVVFRLVAQAAGGVPREVEGRRGEIDVDAIADAIVPGVRVVFLANPNNPTGAHVGRADLERLLARLPEGVVLAVDEAYIEFARDPELVSSLTLARPAHACITLRTFSKMYGLAGLRVGYAATRNLKIASLLDRVRQPFNVNALAQVAALAALEDDDHVARTRDMNERGDRQLRAGLTALGLSVAPSQGNFLLVDLGRDGAAVASALERVGVFVRPVGVYGLPRAIRVTIGTEPQNVRFLRELGRVLDATASSL
ncbi:MAG: histidinol-phosphate transaminase [bacterium]